MEVNNEKANIKNQINIENNYAPINMNNGGQNENVENAEIDKAALKEMISKNRVKKVLDILVKTFPDQNDFTLLKSRFSGIERENRIGVISSSAYNMERNKIVIAVLDMIDEL
jgi:hypothetical protein